MTVARMHTQRTVQRGFDVARYTGQRPITRGGRPVTTPPVVPATGATAGTPGSYTPAGATVPADLAGLAGVVASPATAWTAGQYVPLSPTGTAYWNGTAWVLGVAVVDDPTTFLAANHTVAEVEAWVDEHPQYADEALSWEEGHQNRVTLMDWLEGFISDRDPGHVP